MKKVILLTTALCFAFISTMSAQDKAAEPSIAEKFMQMYKSQEADFSIVNISATMLNMLAGQSEGEGKEGDILKKLKGLSVISYNYDKGKLSNDVLVKRVQGLTKGYDELMNIKDGDSKVQILTKSSNGKITDFVIVANDAKEFALINILGEIDLNNLSGLKSSLNIKELNLLDDMGGVKAEKKK